MTQGWCENEQTDEWLNGWMDSSSFPALMTIPSLTSATASAPYFPPSLPLRFKFHFRFVLENKNHRWHHILNPRFYTLDRRSRDPVFARPLDEERAGMNARNHELCINSCRVHGRGFLRFQRQRSSEENSFPGLEPESMPCSCGGPLERKRRFSPRITALRVTSEDFPSIIPAAGVKGQRSPVLLLSLTRTQTHHRYMTLCQELNADVSLQRLSVVRRKARHVPSYDTRHMWLEHWLWLFIGRDGRIMKFPAVLNSIIKDFQSASDNRDNPAR